MFLLQPNLHDIYIYIKLNGKYKDVTPTSLYILHQLTIFLEGCIHTSNHKRPLSFMLKFYSQVD